MKVFYDNILSADSSVVTVSSEVQGYEKENAYDGRTGGYWRPQTQSSTLQVTGKMPVGMWFADNTPGQISVADGVTDITPSGQDLVVSGSLTKTLIKENIVEFSGFGLNDFAQQDFSDALNFGTGDYSICGWLRLSAHSVNRTIIQRFSPSEFIFQLFILNSGRLVYDNGNSFIQMPLDIADDYYHNIVISRVSGVLSIYIDGKNVIETLDDYNHSSTDAVLRFGLSNSVSNPSPLVNAHVSMWSIDDTGLNSSDVLKLYEKEKFYFNLSGLAPENLLKTRAAYADYFSIYDHNLAGKNVSIIFRASDDNVVWTNMFEPLFLTSTKPLVVTFPGQAHKYWAVLIGATGGNVTGVVANIGACAFGSMLDFKNGVTYGYATPGLGGQFMPRTNISGEGEFIGRSLYKKPIRAEFVFNPTFTREWVRQFWPEFVNHIERKTFFALAEDAYPEDALFCWCDEIITPENPSHLMSIRLPVKVRIT